MTLGEIAVIIVPLRLLLTNHFNAMQKLIIFAASAALILSATACGKIGGDDEKDNPYKPLELTTKSAEFVQKGNDFSFNFIDRINS